ncbi:hypothetical protein [Planctomicrobium sp. SH664]|uniref:hypothetical protein n=1 Tax=Planctomicrobium sp. SH664 TaxID=3448125 RepID=UPI003F5BD69B
MNARQSFNVICVISVWATLAHLSAVHLHAGDPVTVRVGKFDIEVAIDDDKDLVLSWRGGSRKKMLPELPDVMSFSAAAWKGDAGLVIIAETEWIEGSRSYWWMTVAVDAGPTGSLPQKFTRVCHAEFLKNFPPLKVLRVECPHGDTIRAVLLNDQEIPGTDRKVAFYFENACPIVGMENLGVVQMLYLTPKGGEDYRKSGSKF